jgi:hypothetical protein
MVGQAGVAVSGVILWLLLGLPDPLRWFFSLFICIASIAWHKEEVVLQDILHFKSEAKEQASIVEREIMVMSN